MQDSNKEEVLPISEGFNARNFIVHVLIPFVEKEIYITPEVLDIFMKGYFLGVNIDPPYNEVLDELLTMIGEVDSGQVSKGDYEILTYTNKLFQDALNINPVYVRKITPRS